ncbi:MAG: cysteine--tRNA ligase [Deltaproteobacteria bacterium]|nr:cysteine--tRNA ligase [Deltaproteobacteria bacterium]
MTLRVFNTLGRKKETFEPIEPGKVRMYVCGPTVYDSCHIGHARSVVVFDVIVRYLRVKGYEVTYVRNFTDVDDKIIDKANRLAVDPQDIAERYIKEFHEDMDALNVEKANIQPKATAHIPQIIKFIEHLMDEGFAYQINGDVYYSVEKFKEYGKLSGRRLEEMEAGARVDVDIRKQNPFDFVLWKSSKPGEPAWESPWGMGRPGWHIECSAMSCEYLGERFDIHGGGKDLTFPHHENEIAQSEAIFKKPFVKYWIHNGFVNINQEKMSKSLGNFLMIKDAIKTYHPEVVRLFLLSKHYRSPIDFTEKAMDEASAGLDKIYSLLERTNEKIALTTVGDAAPGDCWERFCEAMDDDFNSAQGVGIVFDTVRKVNRILDQNNDGLSSELKTMIQTIQVDILRIGQTLGILMESPKTYFDKKRSKVLEEKSIDPVVIENLIQKRNAARREKDWEKADEVRIQLQDMNVTVEDRPEGTVWKITT